MGDHEKSSCCNATLTGIMALLVIALILLAATAIYWYRVAEQSMVVTEVAQMATAASQQGLQDSQQRAALLQQNRDDMFFFIQYLKYVAGVHALSEAELTVMRPSIAGNTEMAVVLQSFEADMASINQLLRPDRQVHTYHEAVAACRELLDKDAN